MFITLRLKIKITALFSVCYFPLFPLVLRNVISFYTYQEQKHYESVLLFFRNNRKETDKTTTNTSPFLENTRVISLLILLH